jgi:hypothetical protein
MMIKIKGTDKYLWFTYMDDGFYLLAVNKNKDIDDGYLFEIDDAIELMQDINENIGFELDQQRSLVVIGIDDYD